MIINFSTLVPSDFHVGRPARESDCFKELSDPEGNLNDPRSSNYAVLEAETEIL